MRVRLPAAAVCAALWTSAGAAQDADGPECATCMDEKVVRCQWHGETWDEVRDVEFYSEWAAREFECCALLGATDCADCVPADEIGRVAAIEERHRRWLETAWTGSLAAERATPMLATIVTRITTETTAMSSKHFFLATDHPTERLKSVPMSVLRPELKELEARFPDAVNDDATVEQHEWAYLYLARCEAIRSQFLEFIGLEDDADLEYVSPCIEAFPLSVLGSFQVFELLHDGASRSFGGPERFAFLVTDEKRIEDLFKKHPYGEDEWMRGVLTNRVVSAMLSQYMWADQKFRHMLWMPRVLDMGIPHVFEMDSIGVGAFFAESSEIEGGLEGWESDDWNKWMYRAVRQKKAPSVGHLTRLDPSGSNSTVDDHVAAWSFVSYLQRLHGPERFRSFLDALRDGMRPTAALEETYGQTEGQLTLTWHDWVRQAKGKDRAPKVSKEHTIDNPGSITMVFDTIWEDREKYHLDDRLSAIDALKYAEWEDATNRLLLVVNEGHEVEAEQAVRTLRGMDTDEPVALLEKAAAKAAKSKADDEWRRLIRTAGAYSGASERLVPFLLEFRDLRECGPRIRAEINRSLGELEDPAALQHLIDDTTFYHHLVRAEAATALAALADDGGKQYAVQLLEDESWHVRMASIDIFERLDEWGTLPILIRRLEKENGRLREDIVEVLTKIAGPDSKAPRSHSAQSWLQWWSAHGSDLEGRGAEAEGTGFRTVAASPGSLGRIYSKKFLFLVDISSSMMQGIWTVDANGNPSKQVPKIAYVTQEMIRVIEGLEEGVEFNVLMFAGKTHPWRESIAEATYENKQSAINWLRYLEPGAAQVTDLHGALDGVFDQADAGLAGGTAESVVDTIYLISDGMPTAGVTDTDALLTWLTERNRAHRIRLNVITLGATDTDLGLLNDFAETNDGKCIVITN